MFNQKMILLLAVVFITLLGQSVVHAQKNTTRKTLNEQEASGLMVLSVVNGQSLPIKNVLVTVGEGSIVLNTNTKGQVNFKASPQTTILVEASGYESVMVKVQDLSEGFQIMLQASLPYQHSQLDKVNLPLRESTTRRQLTGSISQVDGDELAKFPDLSLSNALQGRLMGLYAISSTSGLGNNSAGLYVRGLHRGGADGALTLVDGVERPINFLNAEEIASVEVLKDPVSKMMYGSRAANGIVLVTTKRGKENTRLLKVSAEYGVSMPTRLPRYLNSYDYSKLYNEARLNDGFPAWYSEADLAGYQNSKGVNDQLYPNVDYYDYFLNKSAPIKRVNLNYSGGGNNSRYALALGYTGASGFEKIGKTPQQDRINVRGNLDFQITDHFKAFVDAAGIVEVRNWSHYNQDQVFGALSGHRPNEYPLMIADTTVGGGSVLGLKYVPPMGGSYLRPGNLYGELLYGGSSMHNYFFGQTNMGLDLGLNKIIKGLSVKSIFNFDNYQIFQSGRNNTPVTYAIQRFKNLSGSDSLGYVPLRKRVDQLSDQRQSEDMVRTYGLSTSLTYEQIKGYHDLKTQLTHFYYRNDSRTSLQNTENTNTYLKVNYGFKNKMYLDGVISMMGSNKFDKNKFGFFPSIGAAWVMTEEGFLKNSASIQFLKLKSSFGVLGYDRSTDFYLYQNRWYNNGTFPLNEVNVASSVGRNTLGWMGNSDIGWEKAQEFEVGLEGLVLHNRLSFEMNYFSQLRYDIIAAPVNQYSVLAGDLYPFENMGRIANRGFEGMVNWNAQLNEVYIDWGVNFIYSKTKTLEQNTVEPLDQNLSTLYQPVDALFGYISKGLYRSPQELANGPIQILGKYGVGDIGYQDLNGDGVIDQRDRTVIGNSFPRISLGTTLNIRYKRLGLYLLGTAALQKDQMLDNSYYRNQGEDKYSALASERFHPVNNPGGSQPQLTTLASTNNNVASTFWLQSAEYFRLKNAELSYQVAPASNLLKQYRFFLRGTNLLVLSKNKDLDPEVLNAGVVNYPIYRTLTLGAAIHF